MPILAIIHNSICGFKCTHCGADFTVSWIKNFVTPHFFKVKYLPCPKCKKWGWAKVILRKNMEENRN